MQYEVVGYETIHYKDKSTGAPQVAYRLYLIRDPDPGNMNVSGRVVDSVFAPALLAHDVHVGDIVRLLYQPGYNGQARLVGVEVVG